MKKCTFECQEQPYDKKRKHSFNGSALSFQGRNVRNFHSSSSVLSDNLFVHRDSPEDNASTPFEFTAENKKVKQRKILFFFKFRLLISQTFSVPMLYLAFTLRVINVLQ